MVAASIEAAPWLVPIGRHKLALFAAVGVLLFINYWLAIVRPRRMECAPGETCHVDSPAMRINRIVFWTSVVIWACAVAIAYAAPWWVRLQS